MRLLCYLTATTLLLIIVNAFSGCSEEEKVSLETQVNESLIVRNSHLNSGDLPLPNGIGPVLEDSPDINEHWHKHLFIPLEASGDIAGVFLKVKGAEQYYDIPLSVLAHKESIVPVKNGFDFPYEKDKVAIYIEFPADLQVSDLTLQYSVYDMDGNISNLIEKNININCIVCTRNSTFTCNVLEYEFFENIDDNSVIDTIFLEQPHTSSFSKIEQCGSEAKEFEINEVFAREALSLGFESNGMTVGVSRVFRKTFQEVNCGGDVLYDEESVEEVVGGHGWYRLSYNEIVIINLKSDDKITYEILKEEPHDFVGTVELILSKKYQYNDQVIKYYMAFRPDFKY